MTLKEALKLLSTAEKMGQVIPDLDDLSDGEIIALAEYMDDRFESDYDARMEA